MNNRYNFISSEKMILKVKEISKKREIICNKCGKTLPSLEKGEDLCKEGYLCRKCFGLE